LLGRQAEERKIRIKEKKIQLRFREKFIFLSYNPAKELLML
jgi:hypothetical protein